MIQLQPQIPEACTPEVHTPEAYTPEAHTPEPHPMALAPIPATEARPPALALASTPGL